MLFFYIISRAQVMEVKLSVSSSRRISFASDLKNYECDLELEELENERDNPTGKFRTSKSSNLYTFSYDDDENYEDGVDDEDYGNVNIISSYLALCFFGWMIQLNFVWITCAN